MKLEAEALMVRYPGSEAPALEDVSFEVPAGCFYAVLGPNGSGKSTLMKALLGVTPLARGSVRLDGRAPASWDRKDMARAVGAVTQTESVAFPMTTRELVAMGRYPHLGALDSERERDRQAIARALSACDLDGFVHRDVTTLSGGEFQRARIARALAQEPTALVLDEPTASLDIGHEMTILELLRRSADSGMTVMLITHGLDMAARFADRLLLLSRGRVAAEGPPQVVMREAILRDVYGWPVAVRPDPTTGTPRVTPLPSPPPPPGEAQHSCDSDRP